MDGVHSFVEDEMMQEVAGEGVGDDIPHLGSSISKGKSVQVENESTHHMLREMPRPSS